MSETEALHTRLVGEIEAATDLDAIEAGWRARGLDLRFRR